MAAAITESVGADDTQVVYVVEGSTRNNCTAVEIYFTGKSSVNILALSTYCYNKK